MKEDTGFSTCTTSDQTKMDVCYIRRDEKRVERKLRDTIINLPPSSLAGRQAGNLKKQKA